jgi:hypothetical protein
LALADRLGDDQVQPKVKPLPNDLWFVSWFDANPNSPPPIGYDVYVQLLSSPGKKLLGSAHGDLLADLGNSSTEDYGLDVDAEGHARLAFLDTREGPINRSPPSKSARPASACGEPRVSNSPLTPAAISLPKSPAPAMAEPSSLGPTTA